jgi:thiol-disulfide isomerase/thioredoxin
MKKSLLLLLIIGLAGCAHKQDMTLQEGIWRGALQRADGVEIPFNFEVKDSLGKPVLWIMNGAARMRVDSIRQQGDTLHIHMPFFDSDFEAFFQGDGSLKGRWIKHYPDSNRVLGFSAVPHTDYRLVASPRKTEQNVNGRWATTFTSLDGKDTLQAVGEFHQQAGRVTGTFLTVSGDYRYLEGVMDGDTLKLSAFDGSHVYLFRALAAQDGVLSDGMFYAGFSGTSRWVARRDSSAHLPDAFSLTTFRPGQEKLAFSFPDLEGNPVSLADDRFRNKVVIVQIMGSWCPNCMDETQFISDWYRRNRSRGVEIVGLCYERSTDFDQAVRQVLTFKRRFDVQYPLLITGVTPSDPHLLEKTLPQLQHFVGFPTTIFMDRHGNIARIHAGFSGPGTGAHYQAYIREFNDIIDQLVGD